MENERCEELKELYETLIELGVVFYYGSSEVEQGEITSIEFNEDNTVNLVLDDFNEVIVDIEGFIQNHSKEGSNYHTWNLSRKFDSLINNEE